MVTNYQILNNFYCLIINHYRPNGDTYKGEWRNDIREGKGLYKW
jgi:hypothetical protein